MPQIPTGPTRQYTVRSGDTLESIGDRLRMAWRRIWLVNGRLNPRSLRVGQQITIPPRNPWTPLALTLDPGIVPRHDWSYATDQTVLSTRVEPPPALAAQIRAVAERYGLPPALIRAVVAVESNFDVEARSYKGALGLMQLMPAAAHDYGAYERTDPMQNLCAGTAMLVDLLNKYDGNLPLTLAAYNGGPGLVDRLGRVPRVGEPQTYVRRVMTMYRHYLATGMV